MVLTRAQARGATPEKSEPLLPHKTPSQESFKQQELTLISEVASVAAKETEEIVEAASASNGDEPLGDEEVKTAALAAAAHAAPRVRNQRNRAAAASKSAWDRLHTFDTLPDYLKVCCSDNSACLHQCRV